MKRLFGVKISAKVDCVPLLLTSRYFQQCLKALPYFVRCRSRPGSAGVGRGYPYPVLVNAGRHYPTNPHQDH
uniref:Uncharacterized protein n=1 Tax=Romanomermis culicivorax TaxID=13658 RepID=A0A915HK25_ROMCU